MKLPRGYLSWSQYSLWIKSPRQYKKKYFNSKPFFSTKEMDYGKYIGDSIENENIFGLTDNEVLAVRSIPICEHYEYTEDFKISNGVAVKFFIDGYSPSKNNIAEYKTGKETWNKERVDSHGQTYIYGLWHFKKTGVLPTVQLYWMPTENSPMSKFGVELTGECYKFDVDITEDALNNMEASLIDVSNEISDAYESWLEHNEEPIELEQSLLDSFEIANNRLLECQSEVDELKVKIGERISSMNQVFYNANFGSFTFQERKIINYPTDIKNMEQQLKVAKKSFAKNTDKFEIKKSLVFRRS